MPFDDRSHAALEALAKRRQAFEQALSATADEVRHHLAEEQTSVQGRLNRLTAELGQFGAQSIDPERFAALFDHEPDISNSALDTVEKALNTITELLGKEEKLFMTSVKPNKSVYDATNKALERIGRAFGAARVVSAIRAGRYKVAEHARSLGSFPFAKWNRAERGLAPPLIVEIDGADLRAGALAEFLDGHVTLVLVVRGRCSPAPLARLISPAVYVAQSSDPEKVRDVVSFDGPAILAVVPEGSALFTHDPRTAETTGGLTVEFMPPDERRAPVGSLSSTQQAEEIRVLARLAESSTTPEPVGAVTTPDAPQPADKLAAWLLNQADLEGID